MSLVLQSSGGGSVTLNEPTTASNFTQDIPAVTGNVVIDSATQTLTNKTIEGGTIISGTAVASTSGTSIDFTGIPGWVKRVTVMLNGVSTNGTSSPMLQLGDSGGVETTGYACTSSTIGASTGTTGYTTGFTIRSGSASAALLGSFVITNVNLNNWVCFATFGDTGTTNCYVVGGSKALSDVLDRVRITTVNGTDTFDAGSINILYE